jgi:hypothetical protein
VTSGLVVAPGDLETFFIVLLRPCALVGSRRGQ